MTKKDKNRTRILQIGWDMGKAQQNLVYNDVRRIRMTQDDAEVARIVKNWQVWARGLKRLTIVVRIP